MKDVHTGSLRCRLLFCGRDAYEQIRRTGMEEVIHWQAILKAFEEETLALKSK